MLKVSSSVGPWLLVAGVFAWVAVVRAEPAGQILSDAIEAFDAGNWEESEQSLKQVLDSGSLSIEDQSRARKYLGWIHILQNEGSEAVDVFKQLVADDPLFDMTDLSLDTDAPPDEAVRYFAQAIFEWRQEELERQAARLQQTSRSQAFLRSTVVPGWGQRYQGYRGRSYGMLVLAASSIGYAVVADRAFRTASDDYKGAGEGADFDALFQEYNDKSNTADLALGIVATAWALNIIDAAFSGANLAGLQAGIQSNPGSPTQGLQLAFVKRF